MVATIILASAFVVLGCGDDGNGGQDPQSILGTWLTDSIEVLGRQTDCPGEIQLTEDSSVACFTETLTFNPDGSFVQVQTTDEYGQPYDWRTEGAWSNNEDLLTITLAMEGPDAENLQPIEPPDNWVWMWSVSGDTLTIGITTSFASVEAFFTRQD